MSQFLVDKDNIKGKTAIITGDEAHHIRDVFRHRVGDGVRLFDGAGRGFEASILRMDKKCVTLNITAGPTKKKAGGVAVSLAQSLLPHDAMDWLVLKATELGVDQIIPLATHRTIVKLNAKKQSSKRDHWKKIALAGAKQSERLDLPEIHPSIGFRKLIDVACHYDAVILASLGEGAAPLAKFEDQIRRAGKILLVTGPEGGLSPEESRELSGLKQVLRVSLGPRVLRSETASLYMLAVVQYLFAQR